MAQDHHSPSPTQVCGLGLPNFTSWGIMGVRPALAGEIAASWHKPLLLLGCAGTPSCSSFPQAGMVGVTLAHGRPVQMATETEQVVSHDAGAGGGIRRGDTRHAPRDARVCGP